MKRFIGEVWRHIPRDGYPLHIGFALKADGRWNRYGEYGCLYTAFTRDGAVEEYKRTLSIAGVLPQDDEERDLVTIEVDVRPILDLGSKKILNRLGVNKNGLTGDRDDDLETCRTIADFARSSGYNAIRSPSAAKKGEYNLSIYIDSRPAYINLNDGTKREPLNYGPGLGKNFS